MPNAIAGAPRALRGAAAHWTISRADLTAGGGEAIRLVHPSLPEIARVVLAGDGLRFSPCAAPAPLTRLAPPDAALFLVRLAGLAAFLRARGLGIAAEDVCRVGARRDDPTRPWLAAPPAPEWRAVSPALVVAALASRLAGRRLEGRSESELAREVVEKEPDASLRPAHRAALRAFESRRAPEALVAELAALDGAGIGCGSDLLGLSLPTAFEEEPSGLERPASAFGAGALLVARGFARRHPGALSSIEATPGPALEEGGALRGAARALAELRDPRATLLETAADGARPRPVEAGPPLAIVAREPELWDPSSRSAWSSPLDGLSRLEARSRPARAWERVDVLRPRLEPTHVSSLVYLPFRSFGHAIALWESLARGAAGDIGRLVPLARDTASRFDVSADVPVRSARPRRSGRDAVLEAAALLADGFDAEEAAAAAGVEPDAASEALSAALAHGTLVAGPAGGLAFAVEAERARLAARAGTRARADAVARLESSGLSGDRLLLARLARGSAEDLAEARARVLALADRPRAALPLLLRAPASDPDLGAPLVAMRAFESAGETERACAAASRVSPDALRGEPFAERFLAARLIGRLGLREHALEVLGDDDGSWLARARVLLDAHDETGAERALAAARGGRLDREERAEAHLIAAEIAWRRQDFPSALASLRRAMRLLDEGGSASLESYATAGVLASDLGRTEEALALFRRVRELASDSGTRADATLDVAVTLIHAGRAEEAERELSAALAAYEESGRHERYLSALGNRVELAIARGDYAAAREDLARVLVHDAAPGRDHQFLFSVTARQRLALLDGDLEAAASAFAEAEARPAFARHAARREALAFEAARLLAAGDAEAARKRLADAGAFADNRLHTDPLLARLRASAAVDLGETPPVSSLDARERTLVEAEARMRRGDPPGAAAFDELRRRARTAAGAGEVAARVLEWSGRFPQLFASDRCEPLVALARSAAARVDLPGAAARLALLGASRRQTSSRAEAADIERDAALVAEDASTRRALEEARKLARSRIAIVITGETGTGKELVAREVHRASGRRPFVAVNVAALAPTLVESELFGHARGAFTGADRDRAGLLEASSGGTLFLDEIGDLPLPLQAKLLRALQERAVTRVGETRPRPVDLRVVSATHRDLARMVEEGSFRADLYHRIVQHEIHLEPLRKRSLDLARLLAQLLGGCALGPGVRERLLGYGWPGNVRELVSAIESARVLAAPGTRIDVAHLPAAVRGAAPARETAPTYREIVEDARRRAILDALAACGANRTKAAARLRLSRQSLLYEMKKLGIA